MIKYETNGLANICSHLVDTSINHCVFCEKESIIFLDNDQSVFFDCDETLILWDRKDSDLTIEGIPVKIHERHVEELKKFKARGQLVVVWSSGGSKWARTVVETLGLRNHVDVVMAKPKWVFDDMPANKILPEILYVEDVKDE